MTVIYAICCTSESGHVILKDLMESTGKLGYPDTYFNGDGGLPSWKKRLNMDDEISLEKYVLGLLDHRCTPNDVFGVTVLPKTYMILRPVVKPTHHILIRRRDTLRQAIALYRAKGDVEFDEKKIFNITKTIHGVNRRWLELLGNWGLVPHNVWYEDLVADRLLEIGKITYYLGVDPTGFNKVSDEVLHQEDSISEEWYARLKDVECKHMARLMN